MGLLGKGIGQSDRELGVDASTESELVGAAGFGSCTLMEGRNGILPANLPYGEAGGETTAPTGTPLHRRCPIARVWG